MKRVLMLHTGGTLGMSGRRPTPLKPDAYAHQLLTHVPELQQLADVEVRILLNSDSSNITPNDWSLISHTLHECRASFDGFVVVHGTDTMAYTASACAFRLGNLQRPVIFTGSQRPLGETRSDARANLVGAVELATHPIPEVGLFFNSKLLRGVRAVKTSVWQYDAFESPNSSPLAEVGVDVVIHDHLQLPAGAPLLEGDFDPRVCCIELHPGFDAALLDALVTAGVRGFVVRAFGSGNVPIVDNALPQAIERAVRASVPVVLVSQALHGSADLSLYECGTLARQAGAIDGGDLTTPAAVVKLMWGLHAGLDVEGMRQLFSRSLRGEGGPAEARSRS